KEALAAAEMAAAGGIQVDRVDLRLGEFDQVAVFVADGLDLAEFRADTEVSGQRPVDVAEDFLADGQLQDVVRQDGEAGGLDACAVFGCSLHGSTLSVSFGPGGGGWYRPPPAPLVFTLRTRYIIRHQTYIRQEGYSDFFLPRR